jgi:hypothetical protein
MADQQHQTGYIYEAFNVFHVSYYATENRDGKLVRVQKSHKLCRKDEKYKSETCRAVKNLSRRIHQRQGERAQPTSSFTATALLRTTAWGSVIAEKD